MGVDVFLSYKREDQDRAAKVKAALEKAGLSVWWDRALPAGATWRTKTLEALDAAGCVVVLWTEASVSSHEGFLMDEAGRGRARGVLAPALLDAIEPPLGFGQVQAADLVDWTGDPNDPGFQDLVAAVRARIAGADAPPAKAPRRRLRRTVLRLTATAFAAAALALGSMAAWRTWGPDAQASAPLMAVLPFEVAPTDAEAQKIAKGFVMELHHAIAETTPYLPLIGRASIDGLPPGAEGLAQARKDLAVTHVLTGALATEGEMTRVNVELLAAKDGKAVWRETFRFAAPDLHHELRRIALRNGEALRIGARLADTPPVPPEAMKAYMTAMYDPSVRADPIHVVTLLREAVTRAPKFGRAWGAYSMWLAQLHFMGIPHPDIKDAWSEGIAAAQKWVEIEPNSAAALVTLAQWDDYVASPEPYRSRLRRAQELSPNDPALLVNFAYTYAKNGKRAEALNYAQRVMAYDPWNDGPGAMLFALMIAPTPESVEAFKFKHNTLAVPYDPLGWIILGDLAKAEAGLLELEKRQPEAFRRALEAGRVSPMEVEAAEKHSTRLRRVLQVLQAKDEVTSRALGEEILAETKNLSDPISFYAALPLVGVLAGNDAAYDAWFSRLEPLPQPDGKWTDDELGREFATFYGIFGLGATYPFAQLRRDPRIWQALARLDAPAWLPNDTQDWPPDYCKDPGFPYDCTAAFKLALARRQMAAAP